MSCKCKIVSAVLLAGLLATPALATVTVEFVPQDAQIATVGGTVNVDIVATFDNPIVAWGLDLAVMSPGIADLQGFAIGGDWDPVLASLDGDLLGGTALIAPTSPSVLATLTFEGFAIGTTAIMMSDDFGIEEDEGFAWSTGGVIEPGQYVPGTVTVLPEPASLALIALGGLAVVRRRR